MRRLLLVSIVAITAVAAASRLPGATRPLELTLRVGERAPVAQQLHGVARADGSYAYRWSRTAGDCCVSTGEVVVDRRLGMRVVLSVKNDTPETQSFAADLRVPTVRRLHAPSHLTGALSGQLIGRRHDPKLTSVGDSPVLTVLMDGVPVATLLNPPFRLAASSGKALLPTRSFGARVRAAPADVGRAGLGLRLRFRLDSGDTVRFSTRTALGPSPLPGGAFLLGVGLLGVLIVLRRRRPAP